MAKIIERQKTKLEEGRVYIDKWGNSLEANRNEDKEGREFVLRNARGGDVFFLDADGSYNPSGHNKAYLISKTASTAQVAAFRAMQATIKKQRATTQKKTTATKKNAIAKKKVGKK